MLYGSYCYSNKMHTVLIALLVISIIELLIAMPIMFPFRKFLASVVIVCLPFISGVLALLNPNFWMLLVLFFAIYRIINLLRVIENRIQIQYLSRVFRNTSLSLILFQSAALSLFWLSSQLNLSFTSWLYVLAYLQLVAAAVVVSSTIRHLRTTKGKTLNNNYSENELPTLTIAIPARNETSNLNDCLQSILGCRYPKLEILVLDDCSQDKRTPEIIKNFAQQGIRFLAGKVPPDKWLAKNFAYQQLLNESSGDLIVFCGVDTRFEPNSLKALVETLLQNRKSMISLMPTNQSPTRRKLWSLMVQPSRYAWELALPRRLFNRPPVLSTCWIITKELLVRSGGFEAIANSISPESYFARRAIISADGYSFLQSYPLVGISSVKSLPDQRETSIRTRYPQLHRRPEMTAIVSLAEFLTLIAPFLIVAYAVVSSRWLLLIPSSISGLAQLVIYGKIISLTYRQTSAMGYLILPFAAIYDLALLNYSMWCYEFKQVIWKDRNVCIPVMNTVDKAALTTSN